MNNSQLYFSYGMNTNQDEMAYRCPGAHSLGHARLIDHAFRFAVHADVVPCSGSYSTFDVLNYTGSVSGSYISVAAESSNIYVSGSSQFTSTNYNGYVSGTYGAGIPITSSLTNYNGSESVETAPVKGKFTPPRRIQRDIEKNRH